MKDSPAIQSCSVEMHSLLSGRSIARTTAKSETICFGRERPVPATTAMNSGVPAVGLNCSWDGPECCRILAPDTPRTPDKVLSSHSTRFVRGKCHPALIRPKFALLCRVGTRLKRRAGWVGGYPSPIKLRILPAFILTRPVVLFSHSHRTEKFLTATYGPLPMDLTFIPIAGLLIAVLGLAYDWYRERRGFNPDFPDGS